MHRERRVQRVGWMRRLRKPVCCVGAVGRLALGVAALAMTSGLHAAGLFQPVGTAKVAPATKSTSLRRSAHDAWERPVRIDRPKLAAARDEVENVGAGHLLLNVRAGVQLDVVVERTAATRWGYSLSGRVVGEYVGFVTLVVHENTVAGSIWTPESAYELRYIGNGIHALKIWTADSAHRLSHVNGHRSRMPNPRDITSASLSSFATNQLSPDLTAADATAHQSGVDEGSVVDILVVWTMDAERDVGEPQVLLLIDMMVAYANDAFERSGALVSLNLIGAEKVDYAETDNGTDLDRLLDPDDGHLDGVHHTRDALGADLVYMVTSQDGGVSAGNTFSIGRLGSGYTFAHEIGHNFGIQHERLIAFSPPYSHGFTTDDCQNTIMSYSTECYGRGPLFIPIFASPWRYSPRNGIALGVAKSARKRGARGPADAVLTLNRNRHRVANHRPRSGE